MTFGAKDSALRPAWGRLVIVVLLATVVMAVNVVDSADLETICVCGSTPCCYQS